MQSEYQKMISGQLYDPADPKLKQDRITAQDLCFELAQLKPSRLAERILLLKRLFVVSRTIFILKCLSVVITVITFHSVKISIQIITVRCWIVPRLPLAIM